MTCAKKRPILFIVIFYFVCLLFRIIEYFIIRTDQSIIGEAFIHKLIGIGLLALAVRYLGCKWRDIGFIADKALKGVCVGLLFGAVVFTVAYCAEMFIHYSAGNIPSLQFYMTSYATDGNRAVQGGIGLILICVIGNIINVVMEEGVFRGMFIYIAGQKHSFIKAGIISSLLFGLWHITAPVRNVVDGKQSPMGAFMMGLMLVGTSALIGAQFAMLFKMTNAIWIPMAFHFINNTSVNLLHVVTPSGADELQTVRLTITGTLSFLVILVMFIRHYKKQRVGRFTGLEE